MIIKQFTINPDFWHSDTWGKLYDSQNFRELISKYFNDLLEGSDLNLNTLQHAKLEEILTVYNIPFTVKDWTNEYVLYSTNAPERYDYVNFGAFTVQQLNDTYRVVALRKDRLEYQLGRYSSGLYFHEPYNS